MLYAFEIGEEEKERFLECIRQGMRPNQAAKECDSKGTQFRCLRSENSQYFDPEFAAAYEKALAEGRGETEEIIRDMVWDSAAEGNWNARWKLAITWLPEFEYARHSNFNVNVQLQNFEQKLLGESREELEAKKEALEGRVTELKALPPAAEA